MKAEEKKQIYIVTTGEYSDYRIDRVFTTRQNAVEYLDTKDDNYTLEEYDLDEPIERKTQVYRICFLIDKKKVRRVSIVNNRYANLINVSNWQYNNIKTLDIYIESDSRKRALKIASERYGAIIAGEATMYPYLRVGTIAHYGSMEPAYFDFHTGELVLMENQELAVDLPSFVKVRNLNPET